MFRELSRHCLRTHKYIELIVQMSSNLSFHGLNCTALGPVGAAAAPGALFSGSPSNMLFDNDGDSDALVRLLHELRNVSEDDEEGGVPAFAVNCADASNPKLPAAASGGAASAYTPVAAGGFVVEGSSSLPHSTNIPPTLPQVYAARGTPLLAAQSPYAVYGAPAHVKPPPPSFAEAIASTTPLSMQPLPSPIAVSPMPPFVPVAAAPLQDAILLRNATGVFILNPMQVKSTPPYTPATGTSSPPISPLPRYSLPPAVGMGNTFLGSSVAQAQGHPRTPNSFAAEPPQYTAATSVGGSPFLSGGMYTQSITSMRSGTPPYSAAPPPYRAS